MTSEAQLQRKEIMSPSVYREHQAELMRKKREDEAMKAYLEWVERMGRR